MKKPTSQRNFLLKAAAALLLVASALRAEMPFPQAESDCKLPPLARLQDIAVANSALLKRERAAVKKYGAELSRTSKEWLRGVTLEGASQYGSYGDQTVNQLYLGNRVGLSIKISLFDFFATGNATDAFKYQMEETDQNRQALEKEIRLAVITRYNAVLLSFTTVRLAAEGDELAHAHQQMAEQEFRRGEIPISEYSRVMQIATEATIKAETAKSAYREQFALLQEFVGVDLQPEGAK